MVITCHMVYGDWHIAAELLHEEIGLCTVCSGVALGQKVNFNIKTGGVGQWLVHTIYQMLEYPLVWNMHLVSNA